MLHRCNLSNHYPRIRVRESSNHVLYFNLASNPQFVFRGHRLFTVRNGFSGHARERFDPVFHMAILCSRMDLPVRLDTGVASVGYA